MIALILALNLTPIDLAAGHRACGSWVQAYAWGRHGVCDDRYLLFFLADVA